MTIFTIWVIYPGERSPALADAWDEWTVDGNESGWRDAVDKWKRELAQGGIEDYRIIRMNVYSDEIERHFKTPVVSPDVETPE